MTAVTISVTAEDIADGTRAESALCPIALAMTRQGFTMPRVFEVDAYIGYPRRERLDLPAAARGFIWRFDDELPVEPFSFELDVPYELLAATQ